MAPAASKRRSSRQLQYRKRSRYYELDSDDDLEQLSDSFDESALPRELSNSPRPSKRRRTVQHRPKTRSKAGAKVRAPARRKQKAKIKYVVIGKDRKANEQPEEEVFRGPSDGVKPPWTTLPYAILKDIFIFGAELQGCSASSWLLGVARAHRSFKEPALDALYLAPKITSPAQLHGLLSSLRAQKDDKKYHNKVKHLELGIQPLVYSAHNKSLFDIGELVRELPQLQYFEIQHPTDEPPYREKKLPHYHYGSSRLFLVEMRHLRLSSWRWTRDMLKDGMFLTNGSMEAFHEQLPFRNLRALSLCRFPEETHESAHEPGDGNVIVHDIWSAIARLAHLKDITFTSCNAVKEEALKRLPKTLERLSLCGCLEVNSDVLAHYLNDGALHLKELILNHNPALDLAFLPQLRTNCPRLEVLRIEMIFYSEYESIDDGQPLFDELLQADEVPTWPTTMREIRIQHMQKCSAEGAVNLFQSLADGAQELPDLRNIALQCHLNIPWRDRASFRGHWIGLLQRVFKRNSVPPNPYHGSKRQYRLWQEKQRRPEVKSVVYEQTDEHPPNPQRRSQRMKRTASSQVLTSESSQEESCTESADSNSPFVHGLCDVVEIQIDNQRPRETQMTEQNFLDREASGDEDWNEDADDAVDDGYAW